MHRTLLYYHLPLQGSVTPLKTRPERRAFGISPGFLLVQKERGSEAMVRMSEKVNLQVRSAEVSRGGRISHDRRHIQV